MPRPKKHPDDNARKRHWKGEHREQLLQGKWETYKKKRLCMSEHELEESRRNVREAVRRHRKTVTDEEKKIENETRRMESAYSTPQSLGKAVRKIDQCLPRCPMRRGAVLRFLMKKYHVPPLPVPLPKPNNAIPDSVISQVQLFFTSADVAWSSPLARDFVRAPGCAERVSRCYLTCTLKEAFQLFKEKFPEVKLSLSKFSELRPVTVKLLRFVPQTVCLCKQHENFRGLVEAIRSYSGIQTTCEFVTKIVCSVSSAHCMLQECHECQMKWQSLNANFPEEVKESLTPLYFQWEAKEGSLEKKAITDATYRDVLEDIGTALPEFKAHCFVKWCQNTAFESARQTASNERVVAQVDYSENYSCGVQDEITPFHYHGGNQVSIFTCCVWSGAHTCHSIALASDCLEHTKYAVIVCLKKIVEIVRMMLPATKQIDFFSDGSAAQFKSRFTFRLFSYLPKADIGITWNFFASSHGKGVVDALGGMLKSHARRLVLARKETISNAHDFIRVCTPLKVTLLVYTSQDVETVEAQYGETWEKETSQLANVQKIHNVEFVCQDHVRVKQYSSCDDSMDVVLTAAKPRKNKTSGKATGPKRRRR